MGENKNLNVHHFKLMRKALANTEKHWNQGALGGVKEALSELDKLSNEIKGVIKNQLYSSLGSSLRETKDERQTENEASTT